MKRIKLIVLFACYCFLSIGGMAQTPEQLQFWNKMLPQKSFAEIALFINDAAIPGWPKAVSMSFANGLPSEERTRAQSAISLVKDLHVKIQREFSNNAQASNADLRNYFTVANALDKSGGYSNMLLADSLRRLALFRLTEWLVHHFKQIAEVRGEVDRIVIPHLEIRALFEKLASEDNVLGAHVGEFVNITPDLNVYGAVAAVGLESPALFGAQSFSGLIENPSAVALMMRLAGTERFYVINLTGLLVFFEKGGAYEELNPADITDFKKRMGGLEGSFKYPVLSVRNLSVSDLYSVFELHDQPATRKAFLRGVLE